ncbi:MAG: hypothetical protein L0211_17660 [Planctomycetaceae bacterium]|nr:hypothetical protein [Planctomycetaceae bacterium]
MVAATKQSEVCESRLSDWSAGQVGASPAELPPSERDFLVFEAVAFGGASTREAAGEFGLSQTRIMQIRRHVAQWIATSVPEGLDLTPLQQLRLAAHVAEGRVDFLYSQAVGAWRASQKPLPSECRGRSQGDPRYLMAAARICMRQLELAGAVRRVMADAESGSRFQVPSSKSDGREGEAGEAPAEPSVGAPPVRDCSAKAGELVVAADEVAKLGIATCGSDDTCNEMEERRQAFLAALEEDTAPVHPPFTDAGGMLLDSSQPQLDLRANGHSASALLGKPAVAPDGLRGKPAVAPDGLRGKPAVAPDGLRGQPAAAPDGLLGKPAVAPDGLRGQPAVASDRLLDEPGAVPLSRKELRKQRRIQAREQRRAK